MLRIALCIVRLLRQEIMRIDVELTGLWPITFPTWALLDQRYHQLGTLVLRLRTVFDATFRFRDRLVVIRAAPPRADITRQQLDDVFALLHSVDRMIIRTLDCMDLLYRAFARVQARL
jgi:hypothetical protein